MATSRSRTIFYIIAALIAAAVLMMLNYRLSINVPGGVDFLTHWVGTRALFQGESPYSNDVAVRVQETVYGHPAQPGDNEFLDCYFLYMELIFAPFALISEFAMARAAWMTFLELSSLAIFLMCLRIVDWKPKPATLALYLLYALLGYESVRPIINGNVTTVVALLLVGAIWAMQRGRDNIAGVMTALALGKPNQSLIPVLALFVWAISRTRWTFIRWFIASALALGIGAMLIMPDWPLQNISNILHYTAYNPPTTVGAAIDHYLPGPGLWIGSAISAILAVLLLGGWVSSLRSDLGDLLPMMSFTFVAAQWLWISTDPGNYIMLALPTAQILKWLDAKRDGRLWSGALLGGLLCGIWILFLLTVDRSNGNLQSPVMFFPLPLILFVGLALGEGLPLRQRRTRRIQ